VKKKDYHFNVDNEQIVISAMMKDSQLFRKLSFKLKGNFIGDRHKIIVDIFCQMVSNRLDYDVETFEQLAIGRSYGSREYLLKLYSAFSEGQKNIDHHVDRLLVDAIKMKLLVGPLQKLSDLCEDPNAELDDVRNSIYELRRQTRDSVSSDLEFGSKLRDKYVARLRARSKVSEFVPTGFKELDENLTEGLARGKISVWTARPSIGKSTLAWNIADRVANRFGVKTGYFPIEMGTISVIDGIVAARTQISLDTIIKSPQNLTKPQWRKIREATDEITQNENLIFWDESVNLDSLGSILSDGNFGLAVFDLWENMLPKRDQEHITVALDRMRQLAKDNDCHMMILQQTRRDAEKRSDKRPILPDLKNSGKYEETGDLVCGLYREKYYNDDHPDDTLEIEILKQRRGGRMGRVYYRFEGEYGRIGNAVKPSWDGFGSD